jgi:outer membrane protein OmpA-like peptidoglycan-associated protein
MFSLNRRFSTSGVFVLVGLMALSGCATKKYVREQISAIDPRIAEVTGANRENAERIDAVDRRAQGAIAAAQAADTRAGQAQQAAQAADARAGQAQQAAQAANQAVQQVTNRLNTVENRFTSIDNYTPAGEAVTIIFAVNSANLTDQGRSSLDSVASQVASQTAGYLIEIQGFTDNSGSENYNIGLSQRRAEAVLRYLVSRNVSLSRTSIVGLGEDKPIGDNSTRQGREQNRRVEVRVFRAGQGRATN